MNRRSLRVALFLLVLFLFAFTLAADCEEGKTLDSATQVIAYYFHGAFRCPTCRKLEQYSKEAVENNFRNEIASGKIIFKVVNVEEKGNDHFVNDYQLFTKSLVISLVKGGKEEKFKNLAKIWEYVGNKQRFYDYVKEEVTAYLKEL